MKGPKGEEKLVYRAVSEKQLQKYRKPLMIATGITGTVFLGGAVFAFCSAERVSAIVLAVFVLLTAAIFFVAFFAERMLQSSFGKRIEFYADRVVFWHEPAWGWPSMEARYGEIRGACINKADEYGDHISAHTDWGSYEVDTLCVYCTGGEYILFGISHWREENSRRILDEILRRAGVAESSPEEGEYGSGSAAANRGFAELGVEEEEEPADDPEENRYDIESVIGCELYTEKGIRVGKIERVLPAKTDIYIVGRNGKEIRLPAEEGMILGMDVGKKRMTVDAERFFASLKGQE